MKDLVEHVSESKGNSSTDVTYHTHALPGCNQGRNADHEKNGRERSPATAGAAQRDQDSSYETADDTSNT